MKSSTAIVLGLNSNENHPTFPPLEGCPKCGVVKTILTYIHNIPIKRNFVENLPYNPALSQLARDKRKAGILSEVLFWQQVHQGKFHNIDFDRQQYLESMGLRVYRISDGDVKMNLGIVMQELENYIVCEYGEKTTPSFGHPSKGGE